MKMFVQGVLFVLLNSVFSTCTIGYAGQLQHCTIEYWFVSVGFFSFEMVEVRIE